MEVQYEHTWSYTQSIPYDGGMGTGSGNGKGESLHCIYYIDYEHEKYANGIGGRMSARLNNTNNDLNSGNR